MMLAEVAPTPTWYLLLAAVLFAIGTVGLLVRRNPLVMFMCVELMLNAVNLSFVALSVGLDDINGQTAVFFVLVVAAAEVVVGPRHHRGHPPAQARRHGRRHLADEGLTGARRHLADPCGAAGRLPGHPARSAAAWATRWPAGWPRRPARRPSC